MALFLSFRVLNIADMTTDGAFTLGCAVSATAAVAGHPFLGLPLAMLAGAAAGFITAFLQTKLAVPSILAGIITNTGLYTVNLAVMGFSSNVPMLKTKTVFTAAQGIFGESAPYKLIVAALVTVVVCALLIAFLGTRLGLSIRATGDNPDMVRASSINTAFTITVGLCIANAMTALSGAVLAQYQQRFCHTVQIFRTFQTSASSSVTRSLQSIARRQARASSSAVQTMDRAHHASMPLLFRFISELRRSSPSRLPVSIAQTLLMQVLFRSPLQTRMITTKSA